MKILFIVLVCLVFELKSSVMPCQDIQFQPFITCYTYVSGCYFLEGDEQDYSKLEHLDLQMIKPSFIIPQKEEPILIKIISFFHQKKKVQENLMCSLIRKLEYTIICTSVALIYQEDEIIFSEKLRYDTQIVETEVCDEMDINDDGIASLFCFSQFTLKKYDLNLQSKNGTLSFEYDVPDQIKNGCKKTQFKWNKDEYIVAFHQCSSWKLLYLNNSEIHIIAEPQMNESQIYLQEFSFINEISFCVRSEFSIILYLIENNSYHQVQFNKLQKSTFHIKDYFQPTKRIHKILVQPRCYIIILFISDSNQKVTDSLLPNVITLPLEYQNHNIYFHSNLLFLQNLSQLTVFLNASIKQTYQIFKTPLYFFQQANLFCQFDESKKVLQFYRYNQLSSFIKPKKKYLYIILSKDVYQNNPLFLCLRIVYENNTKEEKSKLVQLITVQNSCQSKLQEIIWMPEAQILFKNSSFSLYNNEGQIRVTIINNHKILDSCLSKLELFQFIGKIEFRYVKLPYYISFQNQNYFYIYNCKQAKLEISYNLDEFDVLESQGNYFIVQKNNSNNNYLRVIQIYDYKLLYQKVNFDKTITSVQQIDQSVFIYLNNSSLLPLIYQKFHQNKDRKYLLKSLYSSEPILFYYEGTNQKFIQYPKVIAVEEEEFVRCFNFQDGQIISIQVQQTINKDFFILAIQNISNSLILNYFTDHEIHQISNYSFSDFQFAYPFKYKINSYNLVVLIMQNQRLSLAIFQYNISSLQLQDIITTDDMFFTFYENTLLHSNNKEWRQLHLNQIQVEIEAKNNVQFGLYSIYQTDQYQSNQDQKGRQLNILIQNNCFKLYLLKNVTKFEIQYNEILKLIISDIFYGPINTLALIANSSIKLKGPFLFRKEIHTCSQNKSSFCIKQYNVKIDALQYMFRAIIFENQIFEIINNDQQIKFIYITFIKDTYFLCFFKSEYNPKIQIIQCSELNDGYCNAISDRHEDLNIQSINVMDVMRTENLIFLKNKYNQAFIYFEDLKFIVVQIPGVVLDVKYIEGSWNQYLFLQKKIMNQYDIDLNIYSINLNQQSLLYSMSISKELEIEQIHNRREFFFKEVKLTSCIQVGSLITIKLLMVCKQYSYFFQLTLNQQDRQIQHQLLKSVRNWESQDSNNEVFTIDYFDEGILVLKEIQRNLFQFYDLREDREAHDYFVKSLNQMIIKRINTTHFIFFNDSITHLGTIGYEIEQQNITEIDYNFELLATNDISEEKALFQIHVVTQKNQFTILFVQMLCLIFITILINNKKQRSHNQCK